MSKEERKVPELRFKGFHDDWEQRKLGEVSDKVREKNRELFYTEVLTNSAEFGIVSQESYFDKEIANTKNISGYYVVRPNDFVYNPRISKYAPVGPIKSNKLSRSGIMSPLYYVFRPNNINVSYLQKYFDSTYWHQFMQMNGDSGARADRFAIRDSVFTEMPIPYPTIEEQERIGFLLSKIDSTIELHQRKINTLLAIKKAYLNEMFPLQGENTPSLRFNYFNDEWEQRKLGQILKLHGGNAFKSTDASSDGVYWLKISNVGVDGIKWDSKSYLPYEFWGKNKNAQLFKGDYVMALTRPILNGKLKIAKLNTNALLNQRVAKLIFYSDAEFGFQMLKQNNLIKKLENELAGTDPPNLGSKNLGNIKIFLPVKIEEQRYVGDLLNKIDSIITLHQSKLENLTKLKQVYLNKMFI